MKFSSVFASPKTVIVAAIVVVGALSALMVGFLAISSQPFFCKSCHSMKPYYDEWKTSSHRNVNCLECHSNPGLKNHFFVRNIDMVHEVVSMVTRIYPSRPHAEVGDASCLQNGCHEKRLLRGKVNFKGVTFDHTPHLTMERRDRKLRCTSCHAQMVMGRHIAVSGEVCFLCHFKNRMQSAEAVTSAFCLKCHKVPDGKLSVRNSTMTFSHREYVKGDVQCSFCHASVVRGDGRVPKIMCFQCHNKPDYLLKIGDLEFIHENHVTKRKVECYLCHTEIEHSIDTLEHSPPSMKNSYVCAQYNCAQCHGMGHLASQLLYQGLGARGVDGKPSSMAMTHVACVACHIIRAQDTASLGTGSHFPKAGAAGCTMCHGSDGAGFLADWQNRIGKAMSAASAELSGAKARRNKSPELDSAISEASFNINFVKEAKGVHNVDYALKILEHGKEQLERLSGSR